LRAAVIFFFFSILEDRSNPTAKKNEMLSSFGPHHPTPREPAPPPLPLRLRLHHAPPLSSLRRASPPPRRRLNPPHIHSETSRPLPLQLRHPFCFICPRGEGPLVKARLAPLEAVGTAEGGGAGEHTSSDEGRGARRTVANLEASERTTAQRSRATRRTAATMHCRAWLGRQRCASAGRATSMAGRRAPPGPPPWPTGELRRHGCAQGGPLRGGEIKNEGPKEGGGRTARRRVGAPLTPSLLSGRR
jgi:uncharacterized membrane protein